MDHLEAISEDEFVASFLAGEIDSARFGDALLTLIREKGWDPSLVTDPRLGDAEECSCRRRLLAQHRGFGLDRELFEGFPTDVTWGRWRITRSELWSVLYINYSYWNVLSGGSRLPTDAAARILKGVAAYDVPNDGFMSAAQALREGVEFPELILVRPDSSARPVVLEGHLRITAYALAPDHAPADLVVIMGQCPDMTRWADY